MTETAWIDVIDEESADGPLAEAYAQAANSATGRVANILKLHSLSPQSMLDHLALYRTLLFGPSPLERYQREMIGTLVSVLNDCHY